MKKNIFIFCYVTAIFLILLSPLVYGEIQDANKPQAPTDPNTLFVERMKKQALQGDPNAQNRVGWMFANGEGVPQDYKEAAKWFTKAAEQGYALAQLCLGICYAEGLGVEQNYKQAGYWGRKANEQGTVGQDKLGSSYAQVEEISEPPPEFSSYTVVEEKEKETKDDYRQAVYELCKTAEQGHALAQFCLSHCYVKGLGIEHDYKQAVYWLRKAAEQGHALAQFYLGAFYYDGERIEQDYKQAVYWFRKAAEQGNAWAQNDLGRCYYYGNGIIEDYVEAYKWFLLAGMNGADVSKDKRLLQYHLNELEIRQAQQRAKDFIEQHKISKQWPKENSAVEIMPTLKATGTAFCIHPGGFFVTAAHVVQGANSLKIRTEKGIVPARVISSDEGLDIALLKIKETGLTAIPLVSSSAVKTGEKVFTIGFPNIGVQGFEPKYTEGVISSLTGVQNNPRFFQISVAVQPGNSGGPLVDEKGRVIGIVNAKLDDIAALVATGSVPQNVNYAVKSSFVLLLLEGVEGLKEMPKPTELSREEAIQKAKSAVGLVLCY